MEKAQRENITALTIEQVSGAVESPPDGVQSVEVSTEDQCASKQEGGSDGEDDDDDDDDEPSVLEALSSDQLARRASFKKILDDLSSADASLKPSGDALSAAAAATLQAQQASTAAGGLSSALLPSFFQSVAAGGAGNNDHPAQFPLMLPAQQQLQLQSALLNASSGVVQTLSNQTNIPANLLSSALLNANMAATLNSASTNIAAGLMSGGTSLMIPNTNSSPGVVLDDSTRKREVRLMKNREAARECRRKKKEYVRCLESRVSVLESQNQALIGELRALKELYLPKSQE